MYELTCEDLSCIKRLAKDKYQTYEWNVGYSPKGQFNTTINFSGGIITFSFDLVNGVIANPQIFGDFFTLKDLENLKSSLSGKKLIKEELQKVFIGVQEYVLGLDAETVVTHLLK